MSLMFALAAMGPAIAWAQDSEGHGLLINSDGGTACREYSGSTPASDLDDADICGIADQATQLNRALFYGRGGASRVDSLSLGGELHVNSGRLGLSDQSGGYNLAIGSESTLAANHGVNSIAIGTAQTSDTDGAATTASGYRAIAIGSGAKASSENGIALGSNAVAAGFGSRQGSVAIGNKARAQGDGSVALGQEADASGLLSTAIGHGSVAKGTSSISIGGTAGGTGSITLGGGRTEGDYAQAFGTGATALKRMAWAQGFNAAAKGQHSISLGAYSEASADYAMAMGSYANAAGGGAWDKAGTALGTYASADAQGTAVGNVASAAERGTAVGNQASVKAVLGLAFGHNALVAAGAEGGVALGSGTRATSSGSIAVGNNASAGGGLSNGAVAIGDSANANGSGVALGLSANATYANSVSVGARSVAGGAGSTALGHSARSTGEFSLASGYNAIASGRQSTAVGAAAEASRHGATAHGNRAWANGLSSTAVGSEARATGKFSAATGGGVIFDPATGQLWNGEDLSETTYTVRSTSATGLLATANGAGAQASTDRSSAIGALSSATGAGGTAVGARAEASGANSVALGQGSSATRDNAVSLGSETSRTGTDGAPIAAFTRQLVNLSAGTQDTDAVNVGQLKPVINALGGGASFDAATGRMTAPVYRVRGGTQDNVGDALAALDAGIDAGKVHFVSIDGNEQEGNYNNDGATGKNSIAIGAGAQSNGRNDIYMGVGAGYGGLATNSNNVGVGTGAGSQVQGEYNASLGAWAGQYVQGNYNAAVGIAGGQVKGDSNSAMGNSAGMLVTGNANSAMGAVAGAMVTGHHNVASGTATGLGVQGSHNVASGSAAGMLVKGDGNVALGESAGTGYRIELDGADMKITDREGKVYTSFADLPAPKALNNTVAVGNRAVTDADDAVAIGRDALSSHAGSVALGAGSAADGKTLTQDAYLVGGTARGEVNIGERRLTGLAAGAADTDAVNVAQLKQVVTASTSDAVVYDSAAHDRLTLGGVSASAPVALTNVKKGEVSATSSDAINGAQLYEATQALEAGKGRYVSINDGGVARGNHDNDGATGEDAIAIGVDAGASARGATALGAGATASAEGAVALGAGSVADQANTVSVGSVGNERRITNVADGIADTDAANVGQLKKAGIVDPNGETKDVLTYDSGSGRTQVTLGGGAGGTVITNLADGRVAIGSRDAVNGGQLAAIRDDLQNQIKNVDNRVTHIENNGTGGGGQSPGFVADGSEDQPATVPNGSQGTASGAGAVASGNHATANGAGAIASANNSTALGAGSQATAENSVALGANSVADRANTVSVGSEGAPRQITNVAAGTAPTDAVNVSQLNNGLQEVKDWSRLYTDGRFDSLNRDINRVGNRADAGVASAMAMASLPQAYLPGANMAAASISSFRGEASIAVGVSTISEDGRWIYKLNATGNTRGDMGAGMGVGLQW